MMRNTAKAFKIGDLTLCQRASGYPDSRFPCIMIDRADNQPQLCFTIKYCRDFHRNRVSGNTPDSQRLRISLTTTQRIRSIRYKPVIIKRNCYKSIINVGRQKQIIGFGNDRRNIIARYNRIVRRLQYYIGKKVILSVI